MYLLDVYRNSNGTANCCVARSGLERRDSTLKYRNLYLYSKAPSSGSGGMSLLRASSSGLWNSTEPKPASSST